MRETSVLMAPRVEGSRVRREQARHTCTEMPQVGSALRKWSHGVTVSSQKTEPASPTKDCFSGQNCPPSWMLQV